MVLISIVKMEKATKSIIQVYTIVDLMGPRLILTSQKAKCILKINHPTKLLPRIEPGYLQLDVLTGWILDNIVVIHEHHVVFFVGMRHFIYLGDFAG